MSMRILLVEDNPGDIRLLQEYLLKDCSTAGGFQIVHADRLEKGLKHVAEGGFDAVLLDLSLPDSHGTDTVVRMHAAAKGIPIVVLTSIEDEALGMQLIQAGAQDYLVKGQVTGHLLLRSLRYAVERNRTEAALRDSEERFRNVVEGARDVIFTLSKEGAITSLNQAFEKITQWTRKSWIGRPFGELLHPEDLPLAMDIFRHIVETGESLTCVLRIRSNDRDYVVGEFVGVPHIQNGQPCGVLGIARDITERKRVEDVLERLRHRYVLLLTSAHDGIYGIDLQGNAMFVNPAAARMLGFSTEELVGRRMHDIVHHTKPDGGAYSVEECPIYRTIRDGAVQHVASDVFWRKDGTSFPVEYSSTPIIERGEMVGAVVMFRDISERQRAERALRESEARLRAILDHSPSLVFLKDPEGHYLHVNRQFERAFHLSREAIAGKTDKEIFPAEQAAAFRANDLEVLQAGVPLEFEEVAMHDDGPHTSIVSKFPLYDGSGKLYATCGITIDITERKRADAERQKLVKDRLLLLESTSEGIYGIDPEGRCTFINTAAAKMLGYQPDEVVGKNMHDLIHHRRSDGAPYHEKECPILGAFRSGRGSHGDGEVFWRKDTTGFPISYSSSPILEEGVIKGAVVAFTDISQQKQAEEAIRQAEERYRHIFENAVEGIFRTTLDGKYQVVNPALARLHGFGSPREMMKTVTDIARQIYVEPGRREEFIRRMHHEGEVIGFESQVRRKDGGVIWVSENVRAVRDSSGAIVGYEGTVENITQRKEAEEQLQQSLDRLRMLSGRLEVVREEERARIARELHDELGVWLTCLKIDLSRVNALVGEGEGSKLRRKVSDKIRGMIEQTDGTIAAVQRIVSELRPAVLDDLGLVAAIEWQSQNFQRLTGIACTCTASPEDIEVEPERATTVFRICQEALTNVARHACATAVRVSLEERAGSLVLSVSDNGTGIPDHKIVDPQSFGLLGMRERAALLGGEVSITRSPEKGTTITMRLPGRTSLG
jgi:PAS domain S-box-containing protein